jgi:hypothetical protein
MAVAIDKTTQFPTAARLLRCRKSPRYFNGNGWTDDPSQAQTFPDEIDAARACITHNLHDVELVLRTPITGTELFSTPVR